MCVSIARDRNVSFSNTTLYGADTRHPDGRRVHVLGYQNTVGDGQRKVGVPNAMILPFPALPGTMTRDNVVDTSACKDVLNTYAAAVSAPTQDPQALYSNSAPARVQVFDAGEIYTVVLADNAADIPGALDQVPAHRRPAPNPALFDAYARWYPGWTVALCCFDDGASARGDALVWWYEPMNPERLFLPMLDGHDGNIPDLAGKRRVDHTIVVGVHDSSAGIPVDVEVPDHVRPFFVRRVAGSEVRRRSVDNGDFVVSLDVVRAGRSRGERVLPPGAASATMPA